jgi:hypothetical protein
MKIQITNLGIVDFAEVELDKMTLICGENNTGKTYITYGVYGFLTFWHEGFHLPIPTLMLQELIDSGVASFDLEPIVNDPSNVLKAACQQFQENLPRVFASPASRFASTKFDVQVASSAGIFNSTIERSFSIGSNEFVLTKSENSFRLVVSRIAGIEVQQKIPTVAIQRLVGQVAKEIVFGRELPKPFIISAERTGAAMFKNELNLQRNRLIEEIGRTVGDIDPFELLTKAYSDYPLPVKANINFARKREAILDQQSFIAKAHKDILIDYEDIIGGEFNVDREEVLRFTPKGTKARLSMDESSSSVRSLLDLGVYLRCVASVGDLLVIDEPELNLHPQNQRRVARLLARLTNVGINVLVTTHSDYLIKELNLLLLMYSEDERVRAIADREKYVRGETLDPATVRVYVARTEVLQKPGKKRRSNCRTLSNIPVNAITGIEIPSFDNAIEEMNRIEDELIYGGE